MTLLYIICATLLSGALSLAAATFFSFTLLKRLIKHLLSFSVGILLGTALLHLLPESLAEADNNELIMQYVLAGIIGVFLLEKLAILRHNHHYEGDGHAHRHGHDAEIAGRGGWAILIGSGFHNFVDGVLIAAAFLTDTRLGIATTLSIAVHEVAHKLSDFIVLLNAGFSRMRTFLYTAGSSLSAVIGGILGTLVLHHLQAGIPYLLALAASCFIYISISDLMPQMQKYVPWHKIILQLAMIIAGLYTVILINSKQEHHHGHQQYEHTHNTRPRFSMPDFFL